MRVSSLLFVSIIGGCALLPSAFDAQEHARLVTINQLSSDQAVCSNSTRAAQTSREITTHADWVHRYSSSLPDNQAMIEMEQNLLVMSQELSDRYAQGDVSVVYCRSKLDNIQKATQSIMNISARRPRF